MTILGVLKNMARSALRSAVFGPKRPQDKGPKRGAKWPQDRGKVCSVVLRAQQSRSMHLKLNRVHTQHI